MAFLSLKKIKFIFLFFCVSFSVYSTEIENKEQVIKEELKPEERKYLLTTDINYGFNTWALGFFFQYYYFNSFNLGSVLAITNYTIGTPDIPELEIKYHISFQPMFSFGYSYFYKWFSADVSYAFGFEYTLLKEKLVIPKYNINRTYSTDEILYDSGALFSLRTFIYNKAAVNIKFFLAMPDFRKSTMGLGVVVPFGKRRIYK